MKRGYEEKCIHRFGSLQDVARIKNTCANLSIGLSENDVVLNQKQKIILDRIKEIGAGNDNNGNFTNS